MNGAGNDFVVIDNRSQALTLSARQLGLLCDRHRGVGADGVLLVEPAQGSANFRMRYYNADGGEAEMCGNGARCFARFADRLTGPLNSITFETMSGVIEADFDGELVKLEMGLPKDLVLQRNLEVAGQKLLVHSVNTGVPHVITFVEDLEATPVFEWGKGLGSIRLSNQREQTLILSRFLNRAKSRSAPMSGAWRLRRWLAEPG